MYIFLACFHGAKTCKKCGSSEAGPDRPYGRERRFSRVSKGKAKYKQIRARHKKQCPQAKEILHEDNVFFRMGGNIDNTYLSVAL